MYLNKLGHLNKGDTPPSEGDSHIYNIFHYHQQLEGHANLQNCLQLYYSLRFGIGCTGIRDNVTDILRTVLHYKRKHAPCSVYTSTLGYTKSYPASCKALKTQLYTKTNSKIIFAYLSLI